MAKYFHVIWVNPAREWREMLCKTDCAEDQLLTNRHVPGFTVCDPGKWFPRFYRPRVLSEFTEACRSRTAAALLKRMSCNKTVLYLWRPEFSRLLDSLKYDLSVYHIDDEYTFSDRDIPLTETERRVIQRVDQVIVHSPGLLEKKGRINPNTAVGPNGVDYHLFSTPAPLPADLQAVPKPRIGYIGKLKKQLNFELLLELAQRHESWSFVFVGPTTQVRDDTNFKRLADRGNVYLLGRKRLEELPGYTQHLDVCTMCYKMNDYTKYIFPLKLNEYLAAGRPVVGTPIQTLVQFQDVIQLATSTDEWSQALAQAMAPTSSSELEVARRKMRASQFDWDLLVRGIVERMCKGLGSSYLKRFQQAATDKDALVH